MALPSFNKVIANRRNAQKSTGPKTAEGKLKVAQNAMRHGLRAHELQMPSDIGEDADEFIKEIKAYFSPVGAYEENIVAIITAQMWRIRRATLIETQTVAEKLENSDVSLAQAFEQAEKVIVYQRYGSSIERALHRNVDKLRLLQQARRKEGPFIEQVADILEYRAKLAEAAATREIAANVAADRQVDNLRVWAAEHLAAKGYEIPDDYHLPARAPERNSADEQTQSGQPNAHGRNEESQDEDPKPSNEHEIPESPNFIILQTDATSPSDFAEQTHREPVTQLR